jgi:hypothetical protein
MRQNDYKSFIAAICFNCILIYDEKESAYCRSIYGFSGNNIAKNGLGKFTGVISFRNVFIIRERCRWGMSQGE